MTRARRFLSRLVRTMGLVARGDRIPRPLRWCLALGLLPIPGPFDELILLLVSLPLLAFYRQPLRDAWSRTA